MAGPTPLYRVIYDDLLVKIRDGVYRAGDRIPTEHQWAEQFGVSRITSKRALDMAAEMGLIKKFPKKGSFIAEDAIRVLNRTSPVDRKIVGIIQPDLSDSFGLEVFRELQRLAQEHGMLTTTGLSSDDSNVEQSLIASFIDFGVDALVIKPVHNETFNNQVLQLIIDDYPVVLIDRYLKDVSCPHVVSNNHQGAVDGMNYLYSLGHTDIAVMSRPIGATTTLVERKAGIMDAIVRQGRRFRPEWMLTDLQALDVRDGRSFDEAKKRVKSFLVKHREITAVFALKYVLVPVIEEAAFELGLSIPEDLSVLCFDAPAHLLNHIKPITHIRQNEPEIASRVFDSILKRLEGASAEAAQSVDVELVIGRTTDVPRRA